MLNKVDIVEITKLHRISNVADAKAQNLLKIQTWNKRCQHIQFHNLYI